MLQELYDILSLRTIREKQEEKRLELLRREAKSSVEYALLASAYSDVSPNHTEARAKPYRRGLSENFNSPNRRRWR